MKRLSLMLLIMAFLSGCSMFKNDELPDYVYADSVNPLEFPPEMDKPDTSKSLNIPPKQEHQY